MVGNSGFIYIEGQRFLHAKPHHTGGFLGIGRQVSNSSSTTRTAASGTTAITSCDRPATLLKVSRTAALTASLCRKLPSTRSGTTLPAPVRGPHRLPDSGHPRRACPPARGRLQFRKPVSVCRSVSSTHFKRSLAPKFNSSTIQTPAAGNAIAGRDQSWSAARVSDRDSVS